MRQISSFLEPVDYLIIVGYLLVLLAFGYYISFIKNKKSDENLFLAGNSLGWTSIGLNMWGTNVGPSMLIASASVGFTTGIVAGNFAWYAFIFILLLAVVFSPRYLGAKVLTLPEFMGKRFGDSTRNILAWYTLITILISWLSLTLFAGGVLVMQLLDLPMYKGYSSPAPHQYRQQLRPDHFLLPGRLLKNFHRVHLHTPFHRQQGCQL